MSTPCFPSFLTSFIFLFLSPQSGLFTTTSCNLKRRSYCAPGTPAAMQQSKWDVIFYHLHPWEHWNEQRRIAERKRKGNRTLREGMQTVGHIGKGEKRIWNCRAGKWTENTGGMSKRRSSTKCFLSLCTVLRPTEMETRMKKQQEADRNTGE